MSLIVKATSSPSTVEAVDWTALKRDILARLDVAAEYAALGVRFSGKERASGWRECHAFGRIDKKPSAAVNIATGVYKSDGEGSEVLGFFDFAARHGGGIAGTTWLEVIKHYAEKTGVDVPFAQRFGDKGRVEAVYPYTDEQGTLLYEIVRYRRDDGTKTFRARRPDGHGGIIPNLKGAREVPYNLAEIVAHDGTVVIVEGEKDADRACSLGMLATTNQMGAQNSKVWAELSAHLAGRPCIVVPDNDPDGQTHALRVAGYLKPVAQSVRIIELPGSPPKGDLSDWFDAGNTLEEFWRLVGRTPEWEPPDAAFDPNRDATVADLRRVVSDDAWLWNLWLPRGALILVAAEPGTGKTRFCMDLHRRMWNGLPWPDGSDMALLERPIALWVAADSQHRELTAIPPEFGIPDEAIYLNTTAADPFGGTSLQTEAELEDLEARIARIRPAIVFIDTITNTGDYKSQDSADAKRQYKPLQAIALRHFVPIVCVTHLNASGKVLGRRANEKVRVAIQMECPDPDAQPHRRKLWVEKTWSLKPQPLGVSMGTEGNEYDDCPPIKPELARHNGATTGPAPDKTAACMTWLDARLSIGQVRVTVIRDEAEEKGFSAKVLYKAKERLGLIEIEGDQSPDRRKWWTKHVPVNGDVHDDTPF